jgi:hypothetical protein
MKRTGLTQSEGERAVKAILEDRLVKTPFQVWGKVRLNAAIEKTDGEYLPEELFDYLRSAELDYLIFRRVPPHLPFLAVEFDGAHHEFEPKARHNDTLKNRLCRMSGLPILRVRSGEVEPLFRRDSFLSYVVEVLLQYDVEGKNQVQPLIADIQRHDLADIRRLRYELAAKHHVVSTTRAANVPEAELAYDFSPGAVDYESSDTDSMYHGQLVLRRIQPGVPAGAWPVLAMITKTLSLRTHYRTTDKPRPPSPRDFADLAAVEAYVRWLETEPWYAPDFPGLSWLLVAWNLLEGLCLRHLVNDATEGKLPR